MPSVTNKSAQITPDERPVTVAQSYRFVVGVEGALVGNRWH